jgi:hypothetical protein
MIEALRRRFFVNGKEGVKLVDAMPGDDVDANNYGANS